MNQTQSEQETELLNAREFLHSFNGLSVDRCRHESVEFTTLWIFGEKEKITGKTPQIGCVKRLEGGLNWRKNCAHEWETTRMLQGQPSARRNEKTMEEALRWIALYDKR